MRPTLYKISSVQAGSAMMSAVVTRKVGVREEEGQGLVFA